jgi:hypothetical protein
VRVQVFWLGFFLLVSRSAIWLGFFLLVSRSATQVHEHENLPNVDAYSVLYS